MFSFGAQVWLASFQGGKLAVSFFVRELKYNRQKWWTVSLLEDFVILPFWARKPFGSTWTFFGGFGGIRRRTLKPGLVVISHTIHGTLP